ncbi:hypothetical protein [uncultured Endozoicomonas sp.]|uniref:hypothetical protein n=1 Tax=uncultured Endozoicomonas sp. TaxID=432652 RepID=UPI002639044D|nr:hypothetical protein [uncultured Endozoicomonas sp.]
MKAKDLKAIIATSEQLIETYSRSNPNNFGYKEVAEVVDGQLMLIEFYIKDEDHSLHELWIKANLLLHKVKTICLEAELYQKFGR